MRISGIVKKLKKHMPAIVVGICAWVGLWVVTGTSCWIRAIFGIPCPGCGSSRAVAEIFRGDIVGALNFHPLIFLSLAILFVYIIGFVFDLDIFDKFKRKRFDILLWCCFALYLGVYIVRMIMFFPEREPMTYLASSVLGRVIGFFKNILP